MKLLRFAKALGVIDAKTIGRDSLLMGMLGISLVITPAFRFILPFILGKVEAFLKLPLMPFYTPIMGVVLLIMLPGLAGMIIGFILLDQKDDRTLTALRVTPLSLSGYLVYRLFVPVILSLVLTLIVMPLSGVTRLGIELVWPALAAAPLAPLVALFLASFAENKVQGFALMKAGGVFMVPPLLAYFFHAPWAKVFWLVPLTWTADVLWTLEAGRPWAWQCLVALLYQGALIALLLRRFLTGREG